MIIKSIAYQVYVCRECNAIIVSPAAADFPSVCNKCGVPHNVELTQDQRMQMERMKNQSGPTYTVRMS
jgi:hypothetical protein